MDYIESQPFYFRLDEEEGYFPSHKKVREKYLHTKDNTNFIFDFVKDNYALGKTVKPLELPQTKIRATERNELLTKVQQKKFGNQYDKRFIIQDFKTLPWGYISDPMNLSE